VRFMYTYFLCQVKPVLERQLHLKVVIPGGSHSASDLPQGRRPEDLGARQMRTTLHFFSHDFMLKCDIVKWNALITGYTRKWKWNERSA
jgi:hypothetical protein